jgi:hypothetical protein
MNYGEGRMGTTPSPAAPARTKSKVGVLLGLLIVLLIGVAIGYFIR